MTPDVRILHISDPHLFTDPKGSLRGVETLTSLRQVLAHAMRRHRALDAVLCTGDIVNDDAGAYLHFTRELGALGQPVYCVPGNHDNPGVMRRALSYAPFQVGGYVDLGTAWRIVLLDSCIPGKAAGRISGSELRALETALAGTDRYTMVCMHHHPVGMASHWLDAVGIENADELFKILDAHSRVRVVSWGHVHQCFDGRRQGVRLLATPSTGGQFLPLSDEFAIDQRPPAYRRLTLQSDGTIETEVVWVDEAASALVSASA
ncbi:MAG TPA: metallophosphoesterase [Steroidobacteraceae bacterium]|jgi:Icc protein|nr:metallophosphoesterase [Steroidobacteraceae bacterium]